MSIAVLGSGAWGTALATMLADSDVEVTLWGRDQEIIDDINLKHRNPTYLGDISLIKDLKATTELESACRASIILCVTPAQTFANLATLIQPMVGEDARLVLCAKGIDKASGKLLHEVAAEVFGKSRVSALSGPSFAADVARGLPTAVSLAASTRQTASQLAGALSRPTFRIYATDDLMGVETGGALKNVLALAVGIARGLGLGASAEAALIARGFAELNKVAQAKGARAETLAGLSGLGDLVLTCSSPQSRNFSYGVAIAQGKDLQDLPLSEGVHTAALALKLATDYGIEAPIIEMIVKVLEAQITPADAVKVLLARPLKEER
ncbi:MAG: NAD(P)H-dependent glycerol-3-phosphate dehydrogenase [Rhizobiaceae bacterium]